MGSDSTRLSVKCPCNKKKVKKSSKRVPQRGPGVAELEKILGHQPLQPSPFSAFHFPYLDYFLRSTGSTGAISNMMRYQQSYEDNLSNSNFGLSFTQMLTMDDDHPLLQLLMNSFYPSQKIPSGNPGLDSLTQNSPRQNFYNKNGLDHIQTKLHSLKLNQQSMEKGKSPMESEQGNIVVKNAVEGSKFSDKAILTLNLVPMKPITSSSSEKIEDHKTKIFGFNLKEKELSMHERKLSLRSITDTDQSIEHNLDLSLKLKPTTFNSNRQT